MLQATLFTNFIIFLINHHAHCAEVTMEATLNGQNLDINCKYKLAKGEKFREVALKKDGEIFLEFTPDNRDDPEFTKIEGISDVHMDGGGKVTINNYKNTTFGIYSCDLFYAVNDMITYMSKKLKLILKPGCPAAIWKSATKDSIPSDKYVAGSAKGQDLVFCRVEYENTKTPGRYTPGVGCTITWNGQAKISTTFEILTGKDFKYTGMKKGENPPENAIKANKDIYMGRCVVADSMKIGKINYNNMYYADGNAERSDCPDPISIMTCNV